MLDPKYQDRLEKWRKRVLEVPSTQKVRGTKPKSFVARKDYMDDLEEFATKQEVINERNASGSKTTK